MGELTSRDTGLTEPKGRRALLRLWCLLTTGRSIEALQRAETQLPTARIEGWAPQLELAMAWLCFQVGAAQRGASLIRELLDSSAPSLSAKEHAAAYAIGAWLQLETGALEHAVDMATRAAELADATGDPSVRSLATNVLGVIFWGARLADRAVELCAEAVALAREAGNTRLECWWLVNLGGANWAAADLAHEDAQPQAAALHAAGAKQATMAALALASALGDIWTARLALGNLADSAANSGELAEADALLAQYRALGDDLPPRDREHYLDVLATVQIKRGDFAGAIATLSEGRALATASGNVETLLHSALHLSMAYEGLGRFEQALAEHKRYHQLHQVMSAEHARRTARLADVALEADRLRRHAANLAVSVDRDPLTGVYNRRRLDIELSALSTSGRPYLIAMLDLDWFKSVNDRFGHAVGDAVLRQAAQMLTEMALPEEVVARYGGEEFVLLAADDGSGVARLDDLRLRFARQDFSRIAPGLRLTVSIGVTFGHEARRVEDVLKIADNRLYAAKRGGRNRLVAVDALAQGLQQAG
jgi:two-component system cell cycle response regulator